jgi:MFS family permease
MRRNANPDGPRGIRSALRALESRNYRLFFGGQGISLIGTWMQSVAVGWLLVHRLSASASTLGWVAFSGQIPTLFLGPIAGVISERFSRRRILIITQSLALVQAFALATLVLKGAITIWQVVILTILLGIVTAFDAPTRQAFVVELTERREDMSNAIALNSSMFNGARLVGPSIAGPVVRAFGEGVCFLLNGVSYIAVIASLVAMRIPRRHVEVQTASPLQGLKEGFRYTFGFMPIRAMLTLVALTSFAGMPYMVLMPIFAKHVFHGNAQTLGFLLASAGAGALLGAIYLASRKTVVGLGPWIVAGSMLFGAALIAFSLSRVLWLSSAVLLFGGFGMMVQMASCNTVLQTIIDEHMRGRVMSFYTMSFLGTMPFGSLLAGKLGDRIGPAHTVLLGGVVCLLSAAMFLRQLPTFRATIKPIYVKLGILPDMAAGVESASELISRPEE